MVQMKMLMVTTTQQRFMMMMMMMMMAAQQLQQQPQQPPLQQHLSGSQLHPALAGRQPWQRQLPEEVQQSSRHQQQPQMAPTTVA
jgi:hypothetical protein